MGSEHPGKHMPLQFIQMMEDQRFGDIEIFKSDEGKFIMKHGRTYVVNDKRYMDFLNQVKCQQQLKESRAVIPLLYHRRQVSKNLCIDYQLVELYTQYFNFTFEDLIRCNKDMDQSELWLCLSELVALASDLQKNHFCIKLDIENIFITLKGLPAIYPIFTPVLHKDDQAALQSHQMLKNIIDCILKLGLMQLTIVNTMLQKMNRKYRKLATFLKQIQNSETISYSQILETINDYSEKGVIKIANQIKLNKFRYVIPISTDNTSNSVNIQQFPQRAVKDLKPIKNRHHNTLKSKESEKGQEEGIKQKQLKQQRLKQERLEQERLKQDLITQKSSKISVLELQQRSTAFSQLQRKKMLYEEQKEKLQQRKNIIKGINSSGAKQTSKENIGHNSLKASKVSNKTTSWTRKVITSQFNGFDDMKRIQAKLKFNCESRR